MVIEFKVQHLFHIQNQKRNQGTLIETGRNRPVSRNQTAILAGLSKSSQNGGGKMAHGNIRIDVAHLKNNGQFIQFAIF